MSTNGNQQQERQSEQRPSPSFRRGRKIEEVVEQELSSADVQPGQYPSRFVGFGETTIWLPSKFAKSKSGQVEKMNAYFAVKVGEAAVRILTSLVSPPTASGLSSMSNLHKFVRVLATGDSNLWDGSTDNIKRGTKLSAFKGKTSMVVVSKDKKGFARVESLVVAPEGVPIPFPSLEEAEAALEVFLHSGEADAAIPASDEDVPF